MPICTTGAGASCGGTSIAPASPEYLVLFSGTADANGVYYGDGVQAGYPKYKHVTNDYWLFAYEDAGVITWVIGPDYTDLTGSSWAYHIERYIAVPPCDIYNNGGSSPYPTVCRNSYIVSGAGESNVDGEYVFDGYNGTGPYYPYFRYDYAGGRYLYYDLTSGGWDIHSNTSTAWPSVLYYTTTQSAAPPIEQLTEGTGASDAPVVVSGASAYDVSGAGTGAVNGTYVYEGMHNSRPYFKHTSAAYYLYYNPTAPAWQISDNITHGISSCLYYKPESTNLPHESTYTVELGDAPGPTVALA